MKKSSRFLPDIICISFIFILSAIYFTPAWKHGKVFMPGDLMYTMHPWIYYSREAGIRIENDKLIIHNTIPTDIVHQQYPYRMFFHRNLHEGRVPLWNPHQNCGMPFNGNDQSALFYPLNFLFYQMKDPASAYTFTAWFHLFFSGVFMFLFLRLERVGRAGSCLGALLFMFNGCSVAWIQWATFQAPAMWTPLVLLLAGLALRKRSFPAMFFCGIIIAVMLKGGLLQYSSFTLFALMLYLAYHTVVRLKDKAHIKTVFLTGAVSVLTGLAISVVHTWPVMTLASMSFRPIRRIVNGLFSSALDFKHMINIILPDFYGNPVDRDISIVSGPPYNAWTFYIPALALLICMAAMISLFSKRFSKDKRIRTGFYVFLLVFGFAAMFGTPVYALYFYLVPGAETMKVSRIGYLFTFAASALAGFGLDAITVWLKSLVGGTSAKPAKADAESGGKKNRKKKGGGRKKNKKKKASAVKKEKMVLQGPDRYALTAVSLILIAWVMYNLLPWAMKLSCFSDREMIYPPVDITEFLQGQEGQWRLFSGDPKMPIFPNVATALGIDDVRGYDSLTIEKYSNFMNAIIKMSGTKMRRRAFTIAEAPGVLSAPPLDWINSRYMLFSTEINVPWYKRIPTRFDFLYENQRAYERAFFSNDFKVEQDDEKVLENISNVNYKPEEILYLDREPDFSAVSTPDNNITIPLEHSYEVSTWEAEEIVLQVAASKDILLFFSEKYYPGWKASIDDEMVEILRANTVFRAIAVPAGEHTLKMWFAPKDSILGLYISMVSLFITAVIIVCFLFTRMGRNLQSKFAGCDKKKNEDK